MRVGLSGDVSGLLPFANCWVGKADRKITLVQGSSYPGGFWTTYLPNEIMERDMSLSHWRRISVLKVKLKAYRGSRGTAPLILNLGSRWRASNLTSRPLYPEGKNPGTHAWTPYPVWTFWKKKTSCPWQEPNSASLLCAFFWAIPRRLNFICRRFGTLCSIFMGGYVWRNSSHLPAYEDGTDRVFQSSGI